LLTPEPMWRYLFSEEMTVGVVCLLQADAQVFRNLLEKRCLDTPPSLEGDHRQVI
jgi:hypothetical protein